VHGAALTTDTAATGSLAQFDAQSGSRLERLVFNHRRAVMVLWAVLTVLIPAPSHFLLPTRHHA
jgi:hypothetical protein